MPPTQSSGSGGSADQTGAAKIQVRIPAGSATNALRRNFVSSSVQGATVAVGPHGGALTTYAFDLSSASALCTTNAGARSCTMTVTAPFGVDDFAIALYDTAPVSGAIPAGAHVLGQADDDNVTVAAGAPLPTMNVYVSGTISNIGLNGNVITFPADHVNHSANVTIDPSDFSNQPITAGTPDPYSNPITIALAETGGTSDFTLTIDGSAVTSPYTLSQSGHTIGVTFDGMGTTGDYATLTFSATGAATQTLQIAPLYVTPSDPYFNPSAYQTQFTGPNESQLFSVSEAQGSLTYTPTIAGPAACAAGAAVGTNTGTSLSSTITFTSTSNSVSAANACSLVITDSNGSSMSFPFVNTVTGSGPVDIGGITEYTAMSGSEPIVAGPDGNIWVGGTGTSFVERFTTAGTGTQFSTSPHTVFAMADAADGNMWYVDGSNVVSRLTTAGVSTPYSVGGAGTSFTSISEGPDGNAWALDTANGELYDVSPNGVTLNTYLVGCAQCVSVTFSASSPGVVYVTDDASPATRVWILGPSSNPVAITLQHVNPQAIAVDASGNVYVADGTNTIETIESGVVNAHGVLNLPVNTAPRGIAIDGAGNLWVTGSDNDTIVKVTAPSTASPSTYSYAIPTASSTPIGITLGPDGRIWFTEFSAGKIGVIQP